MNETQSIASNAALKHTNPAPLSLSPNTTDISAHLHALFSPKFVQPYQDGWIEITWSDPADGQLKQARKFSAFDLKKVADFAERKNREGNNVYVGAALRQGDMPPKGRANDNNYLAASHAWVDFDGAGDEGRIHDTLTESGLRPALVVRTGTEPHVRAQLWFATDDGADKDKLVAALTSLKTLLKSDNVDNASRVMRLAGTVNFPTAAKSAKGYIPELVTLHRHDAPIYHASKLIGLAPGKAVESNVFILYGLSQTLGQGHSNDDLLALLASVNTGETSATKWHEPMLGATGIMIGRGWSDFQIKLTCAPHCVGGFDDPDLADLIDGARKKWDKPDGGDESQNIATPRFPLIVSSADFLKDFTPPDYLFDGILQRHFIYSMTALTGSGKTAVALMLAVHVALGRSIGERFVEKGRVLYFAGENPDDIRMRWLASAEKLIFNPDTIDVHFLPGTPRLSKAIVRIRAEVEAIGSVALVVIDTSAAYFEADDENSNVDMGNHARFLRELVTLPGEPCVLVACHPTKNANAETTLLPRGGGAFLNEMDGNLTCAKTETVVKLHWTGKFRGPDWAPLHFQLHTAITDTLKDSKGRPIPTVVAMPISEAEQQVAEAGSRKDEDEVLSVMSDGRIRSLTGIAGALCWQTKDHKPNKGRVQRAGDRLKASKLAEMSPRGIVLTAKGKKEAAKIDAINDPRSDQAPEFPIRIDGKPAIRSNTAPRF
jgi:hypothetical protein